jgi:signal transduction histidine kinase
MTVSVSAHASILWSQPGTTLVCNTGKGEDILHGAIPPQDSNSSSTLYFRFRVDPIADSATKSYAGFEVGFVLFDKGEEHLGIGDSLWGWAYSAMNVTNTPKGYMDLNSANHEPGLIYEYIRTGVPKYIVFKVQYVPGQLAHIKAWLSPDLSFRASESNQPPNTVTQFDAAATFDEIRLIHNGGTIGWKFSQMVVGTSFEDLRLTHFWQRGWFFAVIGNGLLVAVAGVVLLIKRGQAHRQIRRLEQERTVAAERARIARDIHDELGASLTKIHKLADTMDKHDELPDHTGTLSKAISSTARDTIRSLDEIVWAINPKNDSLNEIADYLVYFTEDFLRPTGIACALDMPLKLPYIPVTAEMRHNLLMTVKEALNNAVKHATASQIKVGLDFNATTNLLTVQIEDNGRGFHPGETKTTGNGLENMQKRLSAIGGMLNLQSEPGQGTTVKLTVVLPESKIIEQ